MKETIKIIRLILRDEFKENKYQSLNDTQWQQIVDGFLSYGSNPQNTLDFFKNNFQELQFTNEAVHAFYLKFINEMAENYTLNPALFRLEKELLFENTDLKEKINYYKALKLAVRNTERKRIKETFGSMSEKMDFKIEDHQLEKFIQIHARKELKKKFQQWDDEVENEKVIPLQPTSAKKSNLKSFSWMKISIAACVILFTGFVAYQWMRNNPMQQEPQIIIGDKSNAPLNKDLDTFQIHPEIEDPISKPEIHLAKIETKTLKTEILEPYGLGYAGNEKDEINVNLISLKNRIESLDKAFQQTKNAAYQIEAEELKNKLEKYFFDKKTLTIYTEKWKAEHFKILQFEGEFILHLKSEDSFYELKVESEPSKVNAFEKINDQNKIELLNKILFDNE